MEIFLGWLFFSFVIGFIGSGRKIGFGGAFFLSLFLSPLIGLIITLVSKNKEDEAYKEKTLKAQQDQQSATKSIADELEKLKKIRDENSITDEEFHKLRDKLINS
jgi:hypothetical protein